MTQHPFLRAIVVLAAGLLLSAAAQAQAFRTYLSPQGHDGNPCTLAAPCRLLPAALAAVASGGEVWILGSANYNTSSVTIDKPVTILAVPGVVGSVLALGGNAINITAANARVALRNLVIGPFAGGGGTNGIAMSAGLALTVENCVIANLPASGIVVSATADVRVTDTTVRDNGSAGLSLLNAFRSTVVRSTFSGNGTAGISVIGTTRVDVANSTLSGNATGLHVESSSGTTPSVSIFRSQIVRNTDKGVLSRSTGGFASVVASRNVVSNNATGMTASGNGSRIIAGGNTVSNNTLGLENSGGVFESAGDNAVNNNTTQTLGALTTITPL